MLAKHSHCSMSSLCAKHCDTVTGSMLSLCAKHCDTVTGSMSSLCVDQDWDRCVHACMHVHDLCMAWQLQCPANAVSSCGYATPCVSTWFRQPPSPADTACIPQCAWPPNATVLVSTYPEQTLQAHAYNLRTVLSSRALEQCLRLCLVMSISDLGI